jgi:hypothetical protein
LPAALAAPLRIAAVQGTPRTFCSSRMLLHLDRVPGADLGHKEPFKKLISFGEILAELPVCSLRVKIDGS